MLYTYLHGVQFHHKLHVSRLDQDWLQHFF